MDAKLIAKYLTVLKEKSGLTYEAVAEKSGRSESTVKNLCTGKTEDPRLDTVAPVIYAMGGSIDEMYTGKSKDAVKEISINSIKELYEFQLAEYKATEETHINNIRAHYEQHRQDFKESHEKQLEYKDLLYKEKCKEAGLFKILAGIGFGILIVLLILEVSNPSLGWLRF
jgi:transcriptional regulator with XRE-family HTH domain